MTTMTTERVALPMAGLRRTLTAGLEEGTSHPYLAVDTGAPAGYSGCLIMPAGTAAGWAISRSHVAPLHPYIGMQGWWVRDADIEVTAVMSTIERPDTDGDERIPAQYRAEVPEGAYWARMTGGVDGMPQLDEVLCMDVAGRGGNPLLLFWPGHPQHCIATSDRPGLPTGWHGWWAHSRAERIGDVLRGITGEVDRPDLPIEVGTRVRVIGDRDQPTNNGSLATVLEYVRGDRYAPYRVQYDADAPHATDIQKGTRGWWVNEVVAVAEGTVVEETGPFPVGHWFSWGSRDSWYRVARVEGETVHTDRQCTYGRITEAVDTRRTTLATTENFICVPPGHADMPAALREETTEQVPVEAPVFAEGVRVLLTSRHVMQPGDTTNYSEARRGVGFATGVLGQPSASAAGAWRITWDNGGNISVLHESCITPLPTRPIAVGDKVILVTPHTTGRPFEAGGHQYTESPNGVGSVGVVDREPVNDDWGVQWQYDDGSQARHSRVHQSCLMVYPDVAIEAAPETVPETVDPLAVNQRVNVTYGHGWDGPGVVTAIEGDLISVRNDEHGRTGAFNREHVQPVDPMVPPFVPEGARRVRFHGRGAGRVTAGNEYMAIPCTNAGYEGMHLLLAWPGHPEYATMAEHEGRRGVPEGWKSFRTGQIVDDGAWAATPAPTTEPTPNPEVIGYEGVPEEHWASVPEGAIKVRHRIAGTEREWMAIPHNESPRMHILIAWPGHQPPLGVAANNGTRLRQGVPADWSSWAVTLRQGQDLGPWPRVEPESVDVTGEVARLRAELAATQQRYAEDLDRIADIMKEEADRREWCDEYEDVSRRINQSIHGTFNGERPENYEVLFSGTVPFSGRVVLSLPSDPSEAQVTEALRAYFDEHSLSMHGATVDYAGVDSTDLSVDEYDTE